MVAFASMSLSGSFTPVFGAENSVSADPQVPSASASAAPATPVANGPEYERAAAPKILAGDAMPLSSPSAPGPQPENSTETVLKLPTATGAHYTFGFTAAVAFPQPLTIGLQVHKDSAPDFDAFYEAGFFKYPLTDATRSFSDYSFAAGVRWHPFHNFFYVSGELGYRQVGISVDISNLKQDGLALANSATLSMGTVFFGLLVGGEWKLSQNISFAFDLGMQLALLHTGGIEIHADPSQDSDPNDLTVDDSKEMGRISGLPIPQIAVMRFIWYI